MKKRQPSLAKFAMPIHERDKGICWLCGEYVSFGAMHIGHIVDQMVGGPDELDNLACMHSRCNLELKPLHGTREHAEEWRRVYQVSPMMALFVHTYQMGSQDKDKAFAREWAKEHIDPADVEAFVAGIDNWIDNPYGSLPRELRPPGWPARPAD